MSQDIETRVFDLLAAKSGTRPVATDQLAYLNLDSLALAEFSAEIEQSFDVRLDEHLLDVTTVGEMVAYVCDRCERVRT